MLGKWVLLIALAFLVFWFMRQFRQIRKPRETTKKVIEDMVRCAHCDVHLPKSESITDQGRYYCCPQHKQLHSKSQSSAK